MSKIDKYLPRYYKGYDIDELLNKIDCQQTVTQKEIDIIDEVTDIYYKKIFKPVKNPESYFSRPIIDLTLTVPLMNLQKNKDKKDEK